MVTFGLIGLGYWGPNLLRNLVANHRAELVVAADLRKERRDSLSKSYPSVRVVEDATSVLEDEAIEAVVVATPPATHHELTKRALEGDKHVLVTKPLATTVRDAEELVQLAAERKRVLMVDHTFVFTGVVQRLKEMITAGELGEVYYFDSVRVNLGLFQHDVNVMWDLAAHDFSILDYLFDQPPVAIQAVALKRAHRTMDDVGYTMLFYPDGGVAHSHVSWLSPVKIRMTLLGGSDKMAVWDDLASDEKLKLYDRGVSVSDTQGEDVYSKLVDYRMGDIWIPQLDRTEALATEIDEFIDCVGSGGTPRTDGVAGLNVVRWLESADRSAASGGKRIEL